MNQIQWFVIVPAVRGGYDVFQSTARDMQKTQS